MVSFKQIAIGTGLLAIIAGAPTATRRTADVSGTQSQSAVAHHNLETLSQTLFTQTAFADDSQHEKDLLYAEALSHNQNNENRDAINNMTLLVNMDPFNKKYLDTLFNFYDQTMWYGETSNFFSSYMKNNGEQLMKKQNDTIRHTVADGMYRVAAKAMNEYIPAYCKEKEIAPTAKSYRPVIKLLEMATQLEPKNAEYHYELGKAYGTMQMFTMDNRETLIEWSTKAINEQTKSVDLGGKNFVISKRDKPFIRGPPYNLTISLFEKIVKLDPTHTEWKQLLESEKERKEYCINHFSNCE
ncbi:MAG: hypothetical protein Q8O89_05370 [Nanoarchaeota archaeon]|nr:hypothetical protein [Nanoarchaeota archaeon]